MSKRTGRNEPCPCGSGKKYKKCCLDGSLLNAKKRVLKYRKYDIIKYLACLLLIPDNQSKQIRVENAIHDALTLDFISQVQVNHNTTLEDINIDFPENPMEDPVDNLFTQIIMFHGGNFIVYPGISSSSVSQLQMIVDFMHLNQEWIDKDTFSELFENTYFILHLSNTIANRLDHTRYLSTIVDSWQPLKGFSSQNELDRHIEAVTFSVDELDKIGRVHANTLTNYVVTKKDLAGLDYNSEELIFTTKPILLTENELIVLFPSLLVDALRHRLLTIISHKLNFKDFIMLTLTHQTTLMHNEFLRKGFTHFRTQFEIENDPNPYTLRIYKIDTDKFLSHIIISNSEGFSTESAYSHLLDSKLDNSLQQALSKSIEMVSNAYKEVETENIVYLITGLSFGYGLYQVHKDSIVIDISDLHLLLTTEDFNALSLWKYHKALKLSPPVNPGLSFYALWSAYINNKNSFYFSDEALPSYMVYDYGHGSEYKTELFRMNDEHLEADTLGKLIRVIKQSTEYENKIYKTVHAPNEGHYLMVGGYKMPIWITIQTQDNLTDLVSMFAHAISYWLWRMTPKLKDYIELLSMRFINIQISIPDYNLWGPEHTTDYNELKGITTVTNGSILSYEITHYIKPIFVQADNSGDNLLMRHVLRDLLKLACIESTTIDDILSELVNEYFANNSVKMVHINETNDIFSIPVKVPWIHRIHSADDDLILSGLLKCIGINDNVSREITDKTEKHDLLTKVIEYFFKQLDTRLAMVNIEQLVVSLLMSHEALIYMKSKKTWLSSSIINTFPDYTDKLKHEIQSFDRTSSSIRFLIEYSMHKASSTHSLVPNDSIEELLAICSHIIRFSFKKDALKADLWPINVSTLQSGRIGISEEAEGYNKFISSKQQSQFEYYARLYINDYQPEQTLDKNESYSKAIEAEFGISDDTIQRVLKCLFDIATESETGVVRISRMALNMKIRESIDNITDGEIQSFCTMFVLEQRKRWDEIPPGYRERDIQPWQFKRKLSLINRPIIAYDDDLFFGIKSVYKSNEYYLTGIHLGRLGPDCFVSEEMKAYASQIEDKLSIDFVTYVKNQIDLAHPTWITEQDVTINKNGRINIPKDLALGDIDIMAYNTELNVLYSIECKRVKFGRSSAEMRNERRRFSQDSRDRLSWISKHTNRHTWITNHKDIVASSFQLPSSDYRVESLVVISEDIVMRYLVQSELKVVTVAELIDLLDSH